MHTSEQESGQIYIPVINWMLYISVVIVIMSFEHSSNLAAAYGIAVTGTMVLTSILSCSVARHSWHWNKYLVAALFIALLAIDVPLFAANLAKIFSGGWLPLTLGAVMFTVMTSWKSERFQLIRRLNEHGNSLEPMIASLEKSPPTRVAGTAVYMSRVVNVIPMRSCTTSSTTRCCTSGSSCSPCGWKRCPTFTTCAGSASSSSPHLLASGGKLRLARDPQRGGDLPPLQRRGAELPDDGDLLLHGPRVADHEGAPLVPLPARQALYAAAAQRPARTGSVRIPPNRVIELGSQVDI